MGQGFFKLLRSAHLDLNALAGLALLERALENCRDAAAKRDVIVLDENSGGEIDAVIGSAAASTAYFSRALMPGTVLRVSSTWAWVP